jgi:hypothetical protein
MQSKDSKSKTTQEKLTMMANLYKFAFKIKKFQLQHLHPNLTEREIDKKVYALIESGCK